MVLVYVGVHFLDWPKYMSNMNLKTDALDITADIQGFHSVSYYNSFCH
jgi:hypothetical protein